MTDKEQNNSKKLNLLAIISPTLTIFGIIAAIFTAGAYYKDVQLSPLNMELAEIKSRNESFKEKIQLLQEQNMMLQEKNKLYSNWIKKNNNSHFFEDVVDELMRATTKSNKIDQNLQGNQTYSEALQNNIIRSTIYYGSSYVDNNRQIAVGVVQINPNRTANINITLPGDDRTILMKDIAPGHVFKFRVWNEDYQLIIETINYLSDNIEILIIKQKNELALEKPKQ